MTEIKPVYQRSSCGVEWAEITFDFYSRYAGADGYCYRILYPAAAYEALQKENAELKAEDEISAAVIEKCCNLLAQIAVTLKGKPEELTRHGYHDLPELVSVLHVENELNKQSIAKFEQILEGVPEGAFDGGWTARGIMKHAADLERSTAAQAKRIAELESKNYELKVRVRALPNHVHIAKKDIEKLREQGFNDYSATVLRKDTQYCIVGELGDVRWSAASKNGE